MRKVKTCPKCKQEKSVSEFHRDKNRKDGYTSLCKSCKKGYHQEYERSEKCKKVRQKYAQTPKGKLIHRKIWQRKRAIKKAVNFWLPFDTIFWNFKLKLTKGYCPSCGRYIGIDKLSMDHIFPLSKSGFHIGWNTMPLCGSCNSLKWNRNLFEFYLYYQKAFLSLLN